MSKRPMKDIVSANVIFAHSVFVGGATNGGEIDHNKVAAVVPED